MLALCLDGPRNGEFVPYAHNIFADQFVASGMTYYRNVWPGGEEVWTTYPPGEHPEPEFD